MVIQKLGNIEIKINEPYALVLLPNFLIVKYGEKGQIQEEFEKVKTKVIAFQKEQKESQITSQVFQMLNEYGIEVKYPTKENVQELLEDYAIVPLPNEQEEFDKCINNSSYLKRKIKLETEEK